MSDNDVHIGVSYPLGQLARALTTARTDEDAAIRQQAELRVRRWQQVLDGMAGGELDIDSRTSVRGLPAWVTPDVVHGGFATGEPAAGGPLRLDETDRAQRLGLPADRRALFRSWLTEAGLAELGELLDSGRYRVEHAEEAVTGLAHVISGGGFDPDGRGGTGRRLLGWTTTGHWMLGLRPRD